MGNNFQETKQSLGQRMFENCLVWCDFRKRKGISITLGHGWLLCVERNEAMRFFFSFWSMFDYHKTKRETKSWIGVAGSSSLPFCFKYCVLTSLTVHLHQVWPMLHNLKNLAPSVFQVENEVGTKEIRIPGSGNRDFMSITSFWPTLEENSTHITAD